MDASYSTRTRIRLRVEVFEHYCKGAPVCACPGCGVTWLEFLSIDHVHGGGVEHYRAVSGRNIYAWLKRNNFPAGFRVLCHNCNQSYGNYGYCPHSGKQITEKPLVFWEIAEAKVLQAAAALVQSGIAPSLRFLEQESGVSSVSEVRSRLLRRGEWPFKIPRSKWDNRHLLRMDSNDCRNERY